MSQIIRSRLYWGIGITFLLLLKESITWVTNGASLADIVKAVAAAIIAGLFAGFVGSWLFGKLFTSSLFTKPPPFNLHHGEVICVQEAAGHFKGREAVGGFLCLTDKRLLFKSHKLNLQNHELSILLSDIALVNSYKTLGLQNNGLAVHLANQATEKFVVGKPAQWIEAIDNTKNGLPYGPGSPPAYEA
jgi:hypothetical protein